MIKTLKALLKRVLSGNHQKGKLIPIPVPVQR